MKSNALLRHASQSWCGLKYLLIQHIQWASRQNAVIHCVLSSSIQICTWFEKIKQVVQPISMATVIVLCVFIGWLFDVTMSCSEMLNARGRKGMHERLSSSLERTLARKEWPAIDWRDTRFNHLQQFHKQFETVSVNCTKRNSVDGPSYPSSVRWLRPIGLLNG